MKVHEVKVETLIGFLRKFTFSWSVQHCLWFPLSFLKINISKMWGEEGLSFLDKMLSTSWLRFIKINNNFYYCSVARLLKSTSVEAPLPLTRSSSLFEMNPKISKAMKILVSFNMNTLFLVTEHPFPQLFPSNLNLKA